MRKKLYTITAVVLGFMAVSCGGRKTTVNNAGGDKPVSALQVVALSDSLLTHRQADTLSLGRVKEGELVSKTFNIHNAGDKPLVVISVDKSCGCVSATYPKAPLKPGESGEMEIVFDSKGMSGWVYKTVGVQTSLGQKSYVLIIMADVV